MRSQGLCLQSLALALGICMGGCVDSKLPLFPGCEGLADPYFGGLFQVTSSRGKKLDKPTPIEIIVNGGQYFVIIEGENETYLVTLHEFSDQMYIAQMQLIPGRVASSAQQFKSDQTNGFEYLVIRKTPAGFDFSYIDCGAPPPGGTREETCYVDSRDGLMALARASAADFGKNQTNLVEFERTSPAR